MFIEQTRHCRRFFDPAGYIRLAAAVAIILAASVAPSVASFSGSIERGFDRPGGDFKTTTLNRARPSLCAKRCADEKACKAYTYVKPGVQGPKAKCYLKHTIRKAVKSDCCTSGVKKSALEIVLLEPGRDRPGSDYKSRTLPHADAAICQNTCSADPQCKAFTYTKPGAQGPKAKCWYKNARPAPVANSCCTSGVKTKAAALLTSTRGEDRPGGDYMNFEITDGDPGACASMCALDRECKAYTYVSRPSNGTKAQCWLKNVEAPAIKDDCCISGIRKESRNANPSNSGKPLAFVFSERTREDPRSGYMFPIDMPAIRWPKGYTGCSTSDKQQIHEAWALAHFYAWRAHQTMQYLDRNEEHRKRMWNYDHINDYANAPSYENVSMRGWFGPYDGKRFVQIRDSIEKVWDKRFRGTTYTVKCRRNEGNKGAHPCYRKIPVTGNYPSANHLVNGTINFCDKWFSPNRRNSLRAKTIVHELYHWLKIPKSGYWVSDTHDYWVACGKYRVAGPLYGKKAVYIANYSGCKGRNYNRTIRNNDNYALFTYMFGRAVYDGKTVRGLAFRQFPSSGFKW